MITLTLDIAPRWITLAPGLDVHVRAMNNGIYMAARAADPVTEAEAARDGEAWAFALGVEVAKRVILDWRGVGDEAGQPLPVSPEAIIALMHMRLPFDAFYDQYLGPWMTVLEEKKGFAPLPSGTSAGAPIIAADAPGAAPSAPA